MDPISLTLRVGRLPAADVPVGGELSAAQIDGNFTALRTGADQLALALQPFVSAIAPDPADRPFWVLPTGELALHDGEYWFIPTGVPGTNGADGREVQFRVSATHIQWRYVGVASWTDLLALSSLGTSGPTYQQVRKASYLI